MEITKPAVYLGPHYPVPVEHETASGQIDAQASTETALTQDQVRFSKGYRAMSLMAGTGEVDEVRMERVKEIKVELDNGTYNLKPAEIADRMLSEHLYN